MLFNIWVTTACNLKCKYCYEGAHTNGVNMEINTANKVLRYLISRIDNSKNKYIVVNYHGGEPLLNYEIIHYMTEELNKKYPLKKILYGITTNGLLLDKERSNYLAENFLYNLSISIDGGKEVHDYNRITSLEEGTHEKVVEKIRPLLKIRKDMRARITYTPETITSLYKSVKNVIDLGFYTIVPVPNYSDKNWTEKHAEILKEEVCKMYMLYGKQKDYNISLLNPKFTIAKGKCNAGIGEINIDVYGRIYPCTCMVSNEKYQLGTVQYPEEKKAYRMLSDSLNAKTECEGCGLEHWCIGARCKLVNKIITGDYGTAPAFLCAETNVLYGVYCEYGGK